MSPWFRRHPPPLSLALQGGGAHGAFTWRVLDALLERGLSIAAISGASAGAMNAVVCAHGLATDGVEGARAALETFWRAVAERMPPLWHLPGDPPRLAPAGRALLAWARWLSPAQLNPLNVNPLREVLSAQVDFERLRAAPRPALFVAATEAQTARLALFRRADLTLDALLASACLPTIAHPVMIEGRALWDGAFTANPPLWPLVREADAVDLLLVTLAPLSHQTLPGDAPGIAARTLDIGFAAPFLREARWLAEAQADVHTGQWTLLRGTLERRLARLRWHLIDADEAVSHLPGETRLLPEWEFLCSLRDQGRQAARRWWDAHHKALGRASSIDALSCFGGDAPRR